MLKEPTPKQTLLLEMWANHSGLRIKQQPERGSDMWAYTWMSEVVAAARLGISKQASIAILSGLVKGGWATTVGDAGEVCWELTHDGMDAIQFFVN